MKMKSEAIISTLIEHHVGEHFVLSIYKFLDEILCEFKQIYILPFLINISLGFDWKIL